MGPHFPMHACAHANHLKDGTDRNWSGLAAQATVDQSCTQMTELRWRKKPQTWCSSEVNFKLFRFCLGSFYLLVAFVAALLLPQLWWASAFVCDGWKSSCMYTMKIWSMEQDPKRISFPRIYNSPGSSQDSHTRSLQMITLPQLWQLWRREGPSTTTWRCAHDFSWLNDLSL